ncbi:MAG: hypothetical protein VKN33_00535 [Candidatus Sericytochromatia bacterium]|nr:hypothetical protein [Candidatus Sericytochromatia bacterium]
MANLSASLGACERRGFGVERGARVGRGRTVGVGRGVAGGVGEKVGAGVGPGVAGTRRSPFARGRGRGVGVAEGGLLTLSTCTIRAGCEALWPPLKY